MVKICFFSENYFRTAAYYRIFAALFFANIFCLNLVTPATGAPISNSINLSGLLFPCQNCGLSSDGLYRLTIKQEDFLLPPVEARLKLFALTAPEQLADLNKPGEILRFLLSQDVSSQEIANCLSAFLATQGGRSTLILSFDSIYRSHPKEVLGLVIARTLPTEVLDGLKNSPIALTDDALRLTFLSFHSEEDTKVELYKLVGETLDQELSVTLKKIDSFIKLLAVPELQEISSKLLPELHLIRDTLAKTSHLESSFYSEAGVKSELRRLMRKQRLLSLTGEILAQNEADDKEQLLRKLTSAYDPALDTPLIHEAFRYLIAAVPNAVEILGPIEKELSARDSTIQMMLNPPPTLETSFIVIISMALLFSALGIFALFYSRKLSRIEERIMLTQGLSFEERRELQVILTKFGLSSNVNLAELQSAFRRLAKEVHPDAQSGPNADESFIQLQADYARAKELLSAFR